MGVVGCCALYLSVAKCKQKDPREKNLMKIHISLVSLSLMNEPIYDELEVLVPWEALATLNEDRREQPMEEILVR